MVSKIHSCRLYNPKVQICVRNLVNNTTHLTEQPVESPLLAFATLNVR